MADKMMLLLLLGHCRNKHNEGKFEWNQRYLWKLLMGRSLCHGTYVYGANWITREESNMTQFLPWPLPDSQSLHHYEICRVAISACARPLSKPILAALLFAFMAKMAGESITHLSWWVSRGGISGHIKVIITAGKYKTQQRRNWLDETCIPHLDIFAVPRNCSWGTEKLHQGSL